MTSLKRRLIGAATLWIIFGIVAAGIALSAVFRQHVEDSFHEELFVHIDELQRLAQFPTDRQPYLQRDLSDPRYDVPDSGFYWEIQRDGKVLARSPSLRGAPFTFPPDTPANDEVHLHTIDGPTGKLIIAEQLVRVTGTAEPIRFVIGTDQRHLDAVLANFNTTMSWALAIFGFSMVGAAALLIAFAMRPFHTLRQALTRVRSGDDKRLEGDFPSEVVPLVKDLNALLGSTSEMIQRARTQAGNLAHGLKTPLAILTDEGYRLGDAGSEQASSTILKQCKKMQTHIDYAVTRARAVAMRSSPGVVADVRAAADDVAQALRRLYKDSDVTVDVAIPQGIKVACDPQDLNEMLANLVDNACKHAKSRVKISAVDNATDRLVSLIVEDDGPGLPPEALKVVLNIGERWDTRKPGTGLGLAIVKDLAELYGGGVQLDAAPQSGLSVSLRLPRAKL